jgi:hypothetical protein
MPGLDRTGPQGEGPMTGGGFGRCNQAEGNRQPVAGRGWRPFGPGQGSRRGFGRRAGFNGRGRRIRQRRYASVDTAGQ